MSRKQNEIIGFEYSEKPIKICDEDDLNISAFVETIEKTICKVQPPFTISICGEWGSGKTSVMNLVEERLSNAEYSTLWVNIWEISQFLDEEDLRKLFLSYVIISLDKDLYKHTFFYKSKSFKEKLKLSVDSFSARIGSKYCNLSVKLNNTSTNYSIVDVFEKTVADFLGKNDKKLVIIIDDLDRVKAKQTLNILNSINMFLSSKRTIFLISLDHIRINKELEIQNNFSFGTAYPQDYLDKILQLKLNMPNRIYNIEKIIKKLYKEHDSYIRGKNEEFYESLIENLGIEYDLDIESIIMLTKYSIGNNPRRIKRIYYHFSFYFKIIETHLYEYSVQNELSIPIVRYNHAALALYALLCSSEAYPDFFDFLLKKKSNHNEIIIQLRQIFDNKILYDDLNDDDLKIISTKYILDNPDEIYFYKFLETFMYVFSVYRNEGNNFDASGLYLFKEITKILSSTNFYVVNDYEPTQAQENFIDTTYCIMSNHIRGLSNKNISCIEYVTEKDGIKNILGIKYSFGAFSFLIYCHFSGSALHFFAKKTTSAKNFYIPKICNWIRQNIPELHYEDSNKNISADNFIQFDEIVIPSHFENSSVDFFSSKANMIFTNINNKLIELYENNKTCMDDIENTKDAIVALVNNTFNKDWEVDVQLKTSERCTCIRIYKKNWQGKLYIAIEPQSYFMQNIFVGVIKSSWNGKFSKEICFENLNSYVQSTFWLAAIPTNPKSLTKGTYGHDLSIVSDDTPKDLLNSIKSLLEIFKDNEVVIDEAVASALF